MCLPAGDAGTKGEQKGGGVSEDFAEGHMRNNTFIRTASLQAQVAREHFSKMQHSAEGIDWSQVWFVTRIITMVCCVVQILSAVFAFSFDPATMILNIYMM